MEEEQRYAPTDTESEVRVDSRELTAEIAAWPEHESRLSHLTRDAVVATSANW